MKTSTIHPIFMLLATLFIMQGCKKSNSGPKPIIPVHPAITAISPTSGTVGTTVTITGSAFAPSAADNTVKFNGTAATITSATATTLVVTAPAGGGTGSVTVTTTGGTATGPTFTYLLAPTVTTISPTTGVAGASVTITGTNFDAVAGNNAVKFHGVATTVTSATTTSLVVKAPAAGTTGAVTVTTTGGTATGPVFTYLLAPVITGINPVTAAAGAAVTITGTNFDATAANNVVKFNGTTAAVTSATTTQIIATVPAGGTNGNITVTTAGGTSNGLAFTYFVATGPNIYVIGSDTRSGFGYWKNSTFTATNDCNQTDAIVGSGTDIYVAGPSTAQTPTYWKNNTAVHVSSQTGYTFSIAVSGTDVYCLGNINNVYNVWKNGTATPLTTTSVDMIGNGTYTKNAMAVSSGDVYVAGAQYLGNSTILKATYWKNGTPIDLTDGIHSGSAKATAVYVSGTDVYVAGVEEIRDINTGGIINEAPRLWKNGVSVAISTPANSIFNSIFCILVKGTDVYIGGQYNGAGAVWKNGTLLSPSTYSVAENVSSIFLYNNTDIYITGASSSSGNNCYWKNGNFVEMDPGCSHQSTNCAGTFANQVVGIYVK
ncbi:IPT/TIG domain-containing protein [Mucilaginibacter sp. BJC16-A38]|uniref:IPT/TIG domain-containing protein n=1 Tax=Mucilaginibacter phenanthrenivorans TaxID=1234842 RepID=UPI00215852EA|nr:IPT/TIG domain-containing protein [Mucilaginibacter phenanthrenivorans]MCR8560282.1 IPT/TIG domain-containing protein [Mucilaginibacter phenanthrenivorans]